jgi:hypothetical protein
MPLWLLILGAKNIVLPLACNDTERWIKSVSLCTIILDNHSPNFINIQQNVSNLTHMGPDRSQIVKYSWLSELYWLKFLQVNYLLLLQIWAVQLIRGVFHLDIPICWFRVIRDPFCVFWILHSWRDDRLEDLGSGVKAKLQSWDYSPEVQDYQDFHITGCQIKWILLYIVYLQINFQYFLFPGTVSGKS